MSTMGNCPLTVKDIIVTCVYDDKTNMLVSMTGINNPRELIYCRDCKYWPSDEKTTPRFILCTFKNENYYCCFAEKKGESENV